MKLNPFLCPYVCCRSYQDCSFAAKKVNDVFDLTLKSFKRQIKLYTAVLEVYGTKITLKEKVY